MRILLTGNRGFIGSYIQKTFKDHEIIGFDLKDGFDIRDPYQIEDIFDKTHPDIVIHCAALAGVRRSLYHPNDYVNTNIIGTNNLLTISERHHVTHFVNFSSSSVYGASHIGDNNEPLKEDDPKSPVSMYGVTKLAAEQLVWNAKIPTTTVRPFTVYGEHGRKDQVLYLWIDAIKRGKPVVVFSEHKEFPSRGFTYIDDLVDGIVRILNRDLGMQPHATYNLGGDIAINVHALAIIFEKYCEPRNIKFQKVFKDLPEGDSMGNLANTMKAKAELKWTCRQNFTIKVNEILCEEL